MLYQTNKQKTSRDCERVKYQYVKIRKHLVVDAYVDESIRVKCLYDVHECTCD